MPKITEFDRQQIRSLHHQSHSQREINKQTGSSGYAIRGVLKPFEESEEVKSKRPRKPSYCDENILRIYSSRDQKKSNKDQALNLAAPLEY